MTETEKSILITGCSTGIGRCVAQGLKARGYRVFATARKKEDVNKLLERGFESLQLDLDDSQSIHTAVDSILQQTGGTLDALFNNGAYGLVGAVEDLSRQALRAQFETNVFGWIELTNRIIPVMRAQGHGRIIQNSSVLGFAAMPYRGAYNASKFAIEGFADTLRQELFATNIQICLIEPGPIISQFRANAIKAFEQYIDAENSAHKPQYAAMLARLKKVGPAAAFTLGPEAVLKKVIHALESKRPEIRYYVTVPTYLFAYLKRFLSFRMMDWVLIKAGGGGKR
jgi:NAD(P)-dependent dehydrogenase (short-subunit alcohol dehydrogenase family)